MSIYVSDFGSLSENEKAHLITWENADGTKAEFTDYGASLVSLFVKNKNGDIVNTVLGYDTFSEYVSSSGCLGATIGRYANRIENASFELDETTYKLYANEGTNTLHGGKKGFDKYIWDYEIKEDKVCFSRLSPDGEENFPGNLFVRVEYEFKDNKLIIRYFAKTDKPTVINLTNHTYFNLNGYGNILNHKVKIYSNSFTPCDENTLPTGEIKDVEGTALDFREFKEIGSDINDSDVMRYKGYDHNFVLSNSCDDLAAEVINDDSSLKLMCYTDQPALQFYTANFLDERHGYGNSIYTVHSGFCLETQHYPASPSNAHFPNTVLRENECFTSYTVYEFCPAEYDLKAEKKLLRKELLKKREEMSDEFIKNTSNKIFDKISIMDCYKNAKTIMIYVTYNKELITYDFINRMISDGKRVITPTCRRDHTMALCVTKSFPDGFEKTKLGIWEIPEESAELVSEDELDLIISPGIAFTLEGKRLGYGGGYYDRLFEKIRDDCLILCPTFDSFFIEDIPMEEHDRFADILISESKTVFVNKYL